MADQDVYFANLPADDLTNELAHRVDSYYNWILTSGRLARWRTAYNTFYGQRENHSSTGVTAGGKQGELSFLMSNEYANLVRHLIVMAQQSKPAIETVAENTDSESKAAAYVAKGIVEYYRRNAGIDANSDQATLISLLMDTAWVVNEWDFSKGDDIAADNGNELKGGDVYSRAKTPLEVIIDFTRTSTERDWIIVKDQVNKFDVAAQAKTTAPDKIEDILALQLDRSQDAIFRFGEIYEWEGYQSSMVDRYTFFHKQTLACPTGRIHVFYNPKLWTYSAANPYRKLPGNRICPGEMILSGLGFSPTNDLLSLQDVIDALISAAVTNMTSLGVNNIWVKSAADFDFEKLAEGMNLFESSEKPEALILNKLPPEWFNLFNTMISRTEAISGVNATARGNTEGKDMSGAAMALLQSMAIQFNNGLSQARSKLIEDNANDILFLTQDFAPAEKLGLIVGRHNRYMMKAYKAEDLKKIKRVFCRQSNPMKDTTAGKLTIAQDGIKMGAIKDLGAYMEVLDTGNIDSVTEPGRNKRLTIDEENDALIAMANKLKQAPQALEMATAQGLPVEQVAKGMGVDIGSMPVMLTDNHVDHINGHSQIIDAPEDRQDPVLVKIVTDHLKEHLKVWGETPVDLLAALGIPPMMAPMGVGPDGKPVAPQGAPGQPQTNQPKPAGDGQAAEVVGQQEPETPGGPNMPTNPLSGEQWNPQTGGLQ